MARPLKKGLDYFPMDTKLDMKLQLVKAKFKLEGIGFVDMLYRVIYNEGYYIHLDEDNTIMLSSEFGITEERFKEMLHFCIDKGLFNKRLWDAEKILTSGGIQKRYFHKTTKRAEQEYRFMLSETELSEAETPIIDGDKYTKKRKEKKRKEKENKENKNDNNVLTLWNDFAKANGLATIVSLSKTREKSVNVRLNEKSFDLTKIFDKIRSSPFLLGKNDRGWKVDFDFVFCSPNKYLRILEGKYDGKRSEIRRKDFVSSEEYESELRSFYQ